MILNLDEIINLKNQLAETFGITLHLHDACGSQSFSFDMPVSEEIQNFISDYLKPLGGTAQFSQSGTRFIVQKSTLDN
ncbi:MAG: hypothetical protein IJ644_05940 [Oscillospiraceae bacterium]|nr:hypothetical protein [Oscillospiraceae bacterium]